MLYIFASPQWMVGLLLSRRGFLLRAAASYRGLRVLRCP